MLYYIKPFRRFINYLFFNLYKFYQSIFSLSIENKPTITIIDEINDFIKKIETNFKKKGGINDTDFNSNIEPEFYNKKQLDEILRIENNTLESTWKTRNLFINTPKGNIIMYYDPYKLAFSYYSDTSSMNYKLLNAVAMKYVYSFYCKDLFIDNEITSESESKLIDILFKEKSTKKEDKKEDKSKVKISLDNAPFAKLKKYTKPTKDNKDSAKEKDYMRNKFVRVGKISDFSMIKKAPKVFHMNGFQTTMFGNLETETLLQKQVMSYKDFKNRKIIDNN